MDTDFGTEPRRETLSSGHVLVTYPDGRTVVETPEHVFLAECGVPEKYREFANNPISDRAGHREIMETETLGIMMPNLIYISGGVGTGKSHMATWLWWQIAKAKFYEASGFPHQARWTDGYSFTSEMKRFSEEKFSVLEQLHEYTRHQMRTLLIDDVFADRATDVDYQNLAQLVEIRRNDIAQHTILTGMLSLYEIKKRSERLADRLAGGKVIVCEGPSWRLR
jgi:DNA replication protein DnaC